MQITKKQMKGGMDCVIVGGCANGIVLQKIRMDAQFIELRRPDYIKPLEAANSDMPEVKHEKDTYEIHAIHLTNTENRGNAVFGIGVVEGQTLTWAFSELVKSHVENVTHKLMQAELVTKQ